MQFKSEEARQRFKADVAALLTVTYRNESTGEEKKGQSLSYLVSRLRDKWRPIPRAHDLEDTLKALGFGKITGPSRAYGNTAKSPWVEVWKDGMSYRTGRRIAAYHTHITMENA